MTLSMLAFRQSGLIAEPAKQANFILLVAVTVHFRGLCGTENGSIVHGILVLNESGHSFSAGRIWNQSPNGLALVWVLLIQFSFLDKHPIGMPFLTAKTPTILNRRTSLGFV